VAHFGLDAGRFVNSRVGLQLHLRGVNAKVVQGGVMRIGDVTKKMTWTPLSPTTRTNPADDA
jgi:hypothetical protein